MTLTRKIAHNTIVQVIGKCLGLLLGLFIVGFLTRYLGKEGYGQYTTIIAFIQVFGIVADLGLSYILIQMISRPDADISKIVSNVLTLRIFSLFIFLAVACLIGFFIPAYPLTVKIGICLAGLAIFFISLNQIIVSVFQRHLKMGKVALGEFIGKLVNLVLIVIVVIFHLNIFFALLALVLANFINFLLVFFFSLKYVKINFRFDFLIWKSVLMKTWPVAVSIISSMIYFRLDTIILSLFKTSGEVGIYGASYRIIEVLNSFPALFIGLIVPLLNESWVINNFERFKSILQKAFDFLLMLVIPLTMGGIFLGKRIVVLIAGTAFMESGSVFRILIFAVSFLFLGQLFGSTVIALGKQKKMMWCYLFTAILGVAGYLIFIPRYSYYGAAGMTIVTEFLIALSGGYIVFKTAKMLPNLMMLKKVLLSSLVMAIFLYLFSAENLFFLIILGVLVYFTVLYGLKGYSKEMVKEIIRIKDKSNLF